MSRRGLRVTHDSVAGISPLPMPGATHHIRVFLFSEATVVAAKRAEKIASLNVKIMAQDSTAITQVCAQVEQVVLTTADDFDPEWHDLHETACAG